jgi:hypothetical protein
MTTLNIFANQSGQIPLSQLDTNFATPITIGTTDIALGDTATTISGLILSGADLGTPTGNLANCTFPTLNQNTTGTASSVTGLVNVGNGGTGVTTSTGTGSTVLSASPTFTGTVNTANLSYTGTLTGSTGVLNIGSGQVYKDASGNVSIGSSTAYSLLDVYGATTIRGGLQIQNLSGTGSSASVISGDSSYTSFNVVNSQSSVRLVSVGAASELGTVTNTPLVFGTNSLERIRITVAGGISFGSSGTAYGSAGQVLISNGDAAPTWGSFAIGNLTGAITSVGYATSLGSFTSANLAGALTDETGSGAAVFATSPTLVTPILGTPTSGVLTNCTGTNLAKAWCNFDGTATTPITPRSNKNISSVTKSSTGVYVLNIATMADANYAVAIGSNGTSTVPSSSTSVSKVEVTSQTATAINMRSYTYLGSSNNASASDTSIISVVVFGN